MASEQEMLSTIKVNAYQQIQYLQSLPLKPSYSIDGQSVSHAELQDRIKVFRETIEWCDKQSSASQPFEFISQGFT